MKKPIDFDEYYLEKNFPRDPTDNALIAFGIAGMTISLASVVGIFYLGYRLLSFACK